jgi:hypothetical protein
MQNVEQTIMSQFGNSPTLLAWIEAMNEWIDPSVDIDNFYSMVWDISQAQGFGLDIWGRIVDINRTLPLGGTILTAGDQDLTAGNQILTVGQPSLLLGDYDYMRVILLKAMANIVATTAPAINQLLQSYFSGRGKCYVQDMGSMTMQYVFEFGLTTTEMAVVQYSGILPKPAGVQINYISGKTPFFGWDTNDSSISGWDGGYWA